MEQWKQREQYRDWYHSKSRKDVYPLAVGRYNRAKTQVIPLEVKTHSNMIG